jgi:glycosyltransferase involved in cell wall biosynthesis
LKNPVCLAPLGVRIEDRVEHVERVEGGKVLLFVSRVQKKKGLVNLVNAWTILPQEVKQGWKVRIVGPDQENHTAELVALCNERGVSQDFEFVGPKFGDELQREYAMADLFVLPTHSENFGSVVVEALAHGLPVITTKGAPWAEIETARCGWWIDIGVEPLINALHTALMLDDKERHEMGLRGRRLVEEKYTWAAVVKEMVKGYEVVVSG